MRFLRWLRRNKRSSVTPRQFVEDRQSEHPLPSRRPEPDRGKTIYAALAPRLPQAVSGLFYSGVAAIGEVGIDTPEALTYFVPFPGLAPPAGYAILVHTGLRSFLYEVSAALHSRMNVFGAGGKKEQSPTATVEETVSLVAGVFRGFMRDGKAPSLQTKLPAQLKNLADALATHAECFIVAHEIGHIASWLGTGVSSELSPADELRADNFALGLVLGGLAQSPNATQNMSQRMVYAGAEFALRVFAGLAHVGYEFGESHPPPAERLQEIRRAAREALGGTRGFMMVSTIAFSQDQMLESIERTLAPPDKVGFVVGLTPERLLSTLSVLIEECVKGMLAEDSVINEISKIFKNVPSAILKQTAEEAVEIYVDNPKKGVNVDPSQASAWTQRVASEAELFKKIARRLPPSLSQFFLDALLVAQRS